MSTYDENDATASGQSEDSDGQNTMAVLSTLGGSEEAIEEGERLGLDPEANKPKISGSSLAVGVVVVLGAVALFGMRMTLGALASGDNPIDDISQIENFLETQKAATKTGNDGPIKAPDAESKQVLEQLKQNPTDHQVPANEVETNPFDLSTIVATTTTTTVDDTTPEADPRAAAQVRASRTLASLKVDLISGNMASINGDLYRVGQKIGDTGFMLHSVDGLKCILKTTDEFGIEMPLLYQ